MTTFFRSLLPVRVLVLVEVRVLQVQILIVFSVVLIPPFLYLSWQAAVSLRLELMT